MSNGLIDTTDALVLKYLQSRGLTATSQTLQEELRDNDCSLLPANYINDVDVCLEAIVESWRDSRRHVKSDPSGDAQDQSVFQGSLPGKFTVTSVQELDGLHSNNILAAKVVETLDQNATPVKLLVTGGSDCSLKALELESEVVRWRKKLNCPVVDLNFRALNDEPATALVGLLDGSVLALSLADGATVQRVWQHKKHVRRIAVSPCGQYLATGSTDCSVCIFAMRGGWQLHEQLANLPGPVESMAFCPLNFYKPTLILGVRNTSLLHFIEIQLAGTLTKLYNMNASGDCHVSFAPLDIVVSPVSHHFGVATSKESGRIIIYKLPSPADLASTSCEVLHQSLNIYGVGGGEFSQPRMAFSPCGHYLATTANDGRILVYHMSAHPKLVKTFRESKATVRTLSWLFHNDENLMVSGGYDKTVRLYHFQIN